MRPAENIEKLIKNINIDTNAKTDKAVLGDVIDAFEKSKMTNSAITQPNIRRTIMKSPITKLAAAAVIIIACFTGLFFWKSTGSGIALADVLTRIEQVTGYMYQMRSRITGQKTNIEWTWTVLISQENGVKMKGRKVNLKNGKVHHGDTYLLPKLNSVIFVMHEDKSYVPIKYDGTKLDFYREECNDPRIIIKQILSCEHTSLGQSVIDGIMAEGFQTTDSAYKGGFMGQADFMGEYKKVDVKLWVDVNTFLPVRLEEDIVTEKGKHIHEVSYDFRWNVVLIADDFEPNIPDDYTLPAGEIIMPAPNKENAIKGLRLFANLTGVYPVSLGIEILDKEATRLIGYNKDSFENLTEDEKTKKQSELISIMGPAFFYEALVEDKKDPAYYGETVGPDDTNKVLLRWRLDDGQYRIIFGDLSIKNVTAEELAELEKP